MPATVTARRIPRHLKADIQDYARRLRKAHAADRRGPWLTAAVVFGAGYIFWFTIMDQEHWLARETGGGALLVLLVCGAYLLEGRGAIAYRKANGQRILETLKAEGVYLDHWGSKVYFGTTVDQPPAFDPLDSHAYE
jgi:hypothetical protein